jgi:hypothetical protein
MMLAKIACAAAGCNRFRVKNPGDSAQNPLVDASARLTANDDSNATS